MARYIQDGLAVDYTPDAAVASGAIVIQGRLIGVATRDLPADIGASLAIAGVFEFDKVADVAITVGELCYLTVATGEVTSSAVGTTLLGKCFVAAIAADTTVRVLLSPQVQETGA